MFIVIGIVVFLVIVYFGMYNSLVGKKNAVENSFATIDVQLKKRYDLIPNLVATAKNYMQHEKSTLENIAALRAKAMNPGVSSDQKVDINNQLSKALGNIMVAVENYPDLKANDQFVMLQRSLNEIESQISAARRTFNAIVTDYNNAVEMFPTNIVASMMGYSRKKVFAAEEHERKNVNVNDIFNS